ncbi:DUF502 domain-containing protein [Fertoebacter nigrum]|uniref:DUF502 domain-containing protein n=1 Tax=Fertoeibacter niger TaxID=2656921 RepID=A0A8X8KMX7_9RHOB|nr:DUF502 domain-containing protein [Fertoeibacter niger]NUB43176.1 DUF502 domain-containing protein [Fertoeibacter niger]
MTEHLPHRRKGLLAGLRSSFLTGLIVILPIGLTIYLIWTVVGWIDSWVLPFVPGPYRPDVLFRQYLGEDTVFNIRGIGVIIFLLFTVLIGWLAKGIIGRSLIRWGEGLVDRMPVVRSIYNGLKQIAETVFAQSDTNFEKTCLVEYPRQGLWAIGFVSTKAKGEIATRFPSDEDVLSVFIPTTPNPTSGFLLYVKASDVIILDMKIEDAAKLIISAGLVYPSPKEAVEALTAK